MIPMIEKHFRDNRQRLVKRMSYRAGSPAAAEDIVQESYYRALKYHRSFDGKNFDNWFSTILNNTLKEYKNSEKGYSAAEYEEDEGDGTPCQMYPSRVMVQIFELIETKSLVQIEVLMLYFHQEYTAKDISVITSHTYSQVHQIILRFRNELKDLYGE